MRKVGKHLLLQAKIEAVLEAARASTGLKPIEGRRQAIKKLPSDSGLRQKPIDRYTSYG